MSDEKIKKQQKQEQEQREGEEEDWTIYQERGNYHYNHVQFLDAITEYSRALTILERDIDHHSIDIGNLNNYIGGSYCELGQYENALPYIQKALEILESQAPGSIALGDCYHNMAGVYKGLGQYETSLTYYQETLNIKNKLIPNTLSIAKTYHDLGGVYWSQGQFEQSLSSYTVALKIQEENDPDSLPLASTYHNIGRFYYSQNQFDTALEYYEKSVDIKERHASNTSSLAITYSSLAHVSTKLQKFTDAQTYCQKSINIQEKIAPNSLLVADAYRNIGAMYRNLSQHETAIIYLQKSLDIQESLAPNHSGKPVTFYNLGICYLKLKRDMDAYNIFLQSVELRKKLNVVSGHPFDISTATYLCQVAYSVQQYDTALNFATQLLSIDDRNKWAHLTKGKYCEHIDSLEGAIVSYRDAIHHDPGYADAAIKILELYVSLIRHQKAEMSLDEENVEFNRVEAILPLGEAINKAENIKESDYDMRYSMELINKSKGKGMAIPTTINLPESTYQVNSEVYLDYVRKLTTDTLNPYRHMRINTPQNFENDFFGVSIDDMNTMTRLSSLATMTSIGNRVRGPMEVDTESNDVRRTQGSGGGSSIDDATNQGSVLEIEIGLNQNMMHDDDAENEVEVDFGEGKSIDGDHTSIDTYSTV